MNGVTDTFLRTEYKYRLTGEQLETFLELAGNSLVPDLYHRYTVYNIYCDSADDRMIIRSLEHPDYKEKIRLRSYTEPDENTPVFLEIKKKYDGLTGKRRIVLKEKDALLYLREGRKPAMDTQIFREIDYAVRLYRPVPKIFAAYDRVCFASAEEDDVRVTYDTNIRYRDRDVSLHIDGSETRLTDDDTYLLEIKAAERCPLWLTAILSEMKLKRCSFSKYGSIYREIRKQD